MDQKSLYADFLELESSSDECCQLDLPHNLYLKKRHENLSCKEKCLFVNGTLKKKILSSSCTDILRMINVEKKGPGRTTSLLNGLYTLKTVCGTLPGIEPLLKFMSISYQMFTSSTKEKIDPLSMKKINLELKHFLIICKTRFTFLTDVSQSDTSEYYECLAALCCLYIESAAMITPKLSRGYRLSAFIFYILDNSFAHYLNVLLQIDQKLLQNGNILLPLIRETSKNFRENFSCKMYLRYILAARHLCINVMQKPIKKKIKEFKKKCLGLQQPSTFYEWLTTHLVDCEDYVDKDDEMSKFLMTCSKSILDSLIILSRESL